MSALDNAVGRGGVLFYLCALVMVFSVLLGGGTRSGFLSDALLQLAALPLLMAALWRMWEMHFARPTKRALQFCLAIMLLPLLQLIPLPPLLWTSLPNRGPSAASFELIGSELPWMPISVSPQATWLAALSALPPLAIFLGAVLLGKRERRLLSLVLLAAGILSAFVGLLQVAQGPGSALRFFDFANRSEAVGFFANRNHFGAFLYAVTLFAAAWAAEGASSIGLASNGKGFKTAQVAGLAAGFTIIVALVAAEAMARSRAGLGLMIVALAGAFALTVSDRRGAFGVSGTKLLVGAIGLAAMFALQFAAYRILERFAVDPMADARIPFARNTIEAAQAYMPFGSGVGSFVTVYGLFEKPQDTLINAFANRAHNDILELWLDTGVAGIGLMGLFAMWLALRSIAIWRRPSDGSRAIDVSLARAATIVVALLIAHSFVDYPLRTGAMMAVMAFACALLVEPPIGVDSEAPVDGRTAAEESGRRVESWMAPGGERPIYPSSPASARAHGASPLRAQGGEQWDKDIEWPAEWRKPPKQR